MKVEDIVEGLNRHIEEIRRELGLKVKGHIVLHRTVEPCSIKAYKKYSAKLYYVGTFPHKIKFPIGGAVIQDRVIDGQEDIILSRLNIELMQAILKFHKSELFDKVIYGIDKLHYTTIKTEDLEEVFSIDLSLVPKEMGIEKYGELCKKEYYGNRNE